MLARVNAPTRKSDGVPFVRRLKAKETLRCEIQATEPEWIFTHWGGRGIGTSTCKANRDREGNVVDVNDCRGCKSHEPERCKGYLLCWNQILQRTEFFEITPVAWECMVDRVGGLPDLRGFRATITRGEGTKARLQVSIFPPLPEFQPRENPKEDVLEKALAKMMFS